jgi:hypothetical protein
MKKLFLITALMLSTSVYAKELTLNDLPDVLKQLRGCKTTSGIFGKSEACTISRDNLWVAIHGDGSMIIFKKREYSSDDIIARGDSVNELLQNFAAVLNNEQAANKDMLNALGPFLPTQ